jgi:hypothetical protein
MGNAIGTPGLAFGMYSWDGGQSPQGQNGTPNGAPNPNGNPNPNPNLGPNPNPNQNPVNQ